MRLCVGGLPLLAVLLLCAGPVQPKFEFGTYGGLPVRRVDSGAPTGVSKVKRKPPFVGVFERELRADGEAECRVCAGSTAQTTRCPRCAPGQPAVHAICEEEWLMQHNKCMFCRLPVRRPLEQGAAPSSTQWSWRLAHFCPSCFHNAMSHPPALMIACPDCHRNISRRPVLSVSVSPCNPSPCTGPRKTKSSQSSLQLAKAASSWSNFGRKWKQPVAEQSQMS